MQPRWPPASRWQQSTATSRYCSARAHAMLALVACVASLGRSPRRLPPHRTRSSYERAPSTMTVTAAASTRRLRLASAFRLSVSFDGGSGSAPGTSPTRAWTRTARWPASPLGVRARRRRPQDRLRFAGRGKGRARTPRARRWRGAGAAGAQHGGHRARRHHHEGLGLEDRAGGQRAAAMPRERRLTPAVHLGSCRRLLRVRRVGVAVRPGSKEASCTA